MPERPVFHAVDAKGRSRVLKAEAIELRWTDGRVLTVSVPPADWGDIELYAEAPAGTPVTSVKPAACNLLNIRIDVLHDTAPADAARKAKLHLTVQDAVPRDEDEPDTAARPKNKRLRKWARAALQQDAEITLRLVGEIEGRQLNRDYRGKDYATNVLTFVYDDVPEATGLRGDLVICVPVVQREAAAQGKTLASHMAHLVVHGVLHLQGFDHENDTDAGAMEAREALILDRLGFANPYTQ